MKTLIIAPHLDDEVLTTGGLIRKRVLQYGPESVGVFFAYGRKYVGSEDPGKDDDDEDRDQFLASNVLGYHIQWKTRLEEGEPGRTGYYDVLGPLEAAMKWFQPDEVVIPGRSDLNQDHRHLHDAAKIALRPGNRGNVTRILEAIAQDAPLQEPSFGLEMTSEDMDVVLDAYTRYRRELREGVHPRSPTTIRAHRRVCGSRFGVEYAEPYHLVSMLERGS